MSTSIGYSIRLMTETLATTGASIAYAVKPSDYVVRIDATADDVTVTLPAAASNTGRVIHIKKTDSSAHVVHIAGNAGELIDGVTPQDLTSQYDSLMLSCNGTGWDIL